MDEFGSTLLTKLLVALALVAFGWLIHLVRLPFVFRQRRRKVRFFGLTKSNPEQIVYLSTVFVLPGGSTDAHETKRNFKGPAVPDYELKHVPMFDELWREPVLDRLAMTVRRRLANINWELGVIRPRVVSSPHDPKQVHFGGSVLTVGSQFYNAAAELYLGSLGAQLTLEQRGDLMVVRTRADGIDAKVFELNSRIQDLAIVERVIDTTTGTTVFFLAGVGTTGTTGAAYYLTKNWAELWKRYRNRPFAICLGFENVRDDPNAFQRPQILFDSDQH